MNELMELIRQARERGSLDELARAIPYSRFLGIEMALEKGEVLGKLVYAPPLIGNLAIPALHGGTIGALLESTAVFAALMRVDTKKVPKTISITFDYLRSGRAVDTFATAEMTKLGRRVANVRAIAWQEDQSKPIAQANVHLLLAID